MKVQDIYLTRRANRPPAGAVAWRVAICGLMAAALAACGSSTSVDTIANPENPTEVVLFDFTDQDIRNPSAFDVVGSSAVRLDSNTRWDFIFLIRRDGTAQLQPRGAVLELNTLDSGLLQMTLPFDEIRDAPVAGYERVRAVTIEEGDVLTVQSQRDAFLEPNRCRRYGKLEILSIDAAAGTLTMQHLINPNCENRNLIAGAAIPIE